MMPMQISNYGYPGPEAGCAQGREGDLTEDGDCGPEELPYG